MILQLKPGEPTPPMAVGDLLFVANRGWRGAAVRFLQRRLGYSREASRWTNVGVAVSYACLIGDESSDGYLMADEFDRFDRALWHDSSIPAADRAPVAYIEGTDASDVDVARVALFVLGVSVYPRDETTAALYEELR